MVYLTICNLGFILLDILAPPDLLSEPIYSLYSYTLSMVILWGRRGRAHMVVGLTTTFAISSLYYHYRCEFESHLR